MDDEKDGMASKSKSLAIKRLAVDESSIGLPWLRNNLRRDGILQRAVNSRARIEWRRDHARPERSVSRLSTVIIKRRNMILVQRENHVDVDGDVISPKALKANDGKTVSVYRDFDLRQSLGRAKLIYVKGEGLHAELDCINLHPEERVVIKFRADKSRVIKTATQKRTRWNKIEVTALGTTMYATDDTLPTIGETSDN